ncbi:hypothetical protein C4A33_02883 [Escherichia coli]|nr:hypothetical protein [Escherichia coli]RDP86934.1 hypothetical protein C4A42_02982 [Escherichia coli]RDQ06617.1 hypothetical protein C4A38_02872 [Escherichia coli]RDQ30795.1 hypothetical protein C4A33_02883 [Escherichia coli]HAJ5476422.1 hypothetical protein [Escherichia coli]
MKLFYLLILLNGTALATVTPLENRFSYTPVPYETYLSAAPSEGQAISTSCMSTQSATFSGGGSGLTANYTYTLKLTPEYISHCSWTDHLNLVDTRTLTYHGCSLQGADSSLVLWPNITVSMPGIGDYSFNQNIQRRTLRANLFEWIRKSGILTMTVNYNNSPLAVPEGEYTLSCQIRLDSAGRELSEIKVDHSVSAYRISPVPMNMVFIPNEIHVSTNGGSWNGTTVLEINGKKGDSIFFTSSVPVRLSLGDIWSEPGTLVTTRLSNTGLATGRVSIQGTTSTPGSQVVNLNATLQRE